MSGDNFQLIAGLAILAPLLGSSLWFWLKPKIGEKGVGFGASATVGISFLCTLYFFFQAGEHAIQVPFFSWIWSGEAALVHFSFLFDPLSLALGLIVTGVGFLIHLYAMGYMHGDESFGRFFSYLNLFIFSMLMLIWSDSLLGIFLGWEGVGLCSYLLISFWFTDLANAEAGKKAFVVNRIGDFGFLLAMFALYKAFGTLNIPELLSMLPTNFGATDFIELSVDQLYWAKVACFGLVLGATGKSAQIPLFVWLPDAMAGPTPVSALIHAATMVTAGIYLICRLQALFMLQPAILEIVALVGGLTAFFAASIAIFQYDIKKVLAYSTISQLGYMFLAVGLMAPVAGYFHLITHAFFKALLFLGAGSVIHGMHHEQDMRKMGGLRKQMPITFWTMTIGVLAIAGVPPLSGFVSKDEILHITSGSQRGWLNVLAIVTAFMTAFYMGRLWIMTFFGKFRGEKHAHESPVLMTSVLIVLAVFSALAGFLNWPELWGGGAYLHHYLSSVVQQAPSVLNHEAFVHSLEIAGFSSFMGLCGLGIAYFIYRRFEGDDFRSSVFDIFKNKYYIDEIYDFMVVRNLKRLGEFLWKIVDVGMIDRSLNAIATRSVNASLRLRSLQTGLTQTYAMWVWIGIIVLLISAWTVR